MNSGYGRFGKLWKRERMPKNWREGIIVPIVKKSEGERVRIIGSDTDADGIQDLCVSISREVKNGC